MSGRITLGEIFREEFRDVISLARQAPRVSIPLAGSSLPWAILAGLGAGFFIAAPVRVLASLLYSVPRTTELQPPTVPELGTIAATACAFAVAWRAGGWLAAEGYLAFVAFERVLTIPRLIATCTDPRLAGVGSPFADRCTLGGQLIALWPVATGGVLAFVIARALSRSGGSTNGTLEAAGGLVFAQALWSPLTDFVLVRTSSSAPDVTGFTVFNLGSALTAGIVAGLLLARRSRWAWRGFAAIAAVVLIQFVWFSLRTLLASLAYGADFYQIGGVAGLLGFGAPLLMLAAAAVVLATSRRQIAAVHA